MPSLWVCAPRGSLHVMRCVLRSQPTADTGQPRATPARCRAGVGTVTMGEDRHCQAGPWLVQGPGSRAGPSQHPRDSRTPSMWCSQERARCSPKPRSPGRLSGPRTTLPAQEGQGLQSVPHSHQCSLDHWTPSEDHPTPHWREGHGLWEAAGTHRGDVARMELGRLLEEGQAGVRVHHVLHAETRHGRAHAGTGPPLRSGRAAPSVAGSPGARRARDSPLPPQSVHLTRVSTQGLRGSETSAFGEPAPPCE